MILQSLHAYYLRLLQQTNTGIAPPGYSQEKISYELILNTQGQLIAINDIRDTSGKNPVAHLLNVPQPEKRTAGVKSNFLWDKTSYTLGASATSKRTEQEHSAFKERHSAALAHTTDEGLKALQLFLAQWTPQQLPQTPGYRPEMLDANCVFRLDGEQCYLHQRPAAQALLAKPTEQNTTDTVRTHQCLVTGNILTMARLHPAIKGVNGAQVAGASIVSFNLDSFTSYGKKQGENAPVSEQAAFAYTTALNHLLRRSEHNRQRLQMGDTTIVFWAQAQQAAQAEATENTLFAILNRPADDGQEAQKLRHTLEDIIKGRPLSQINPLLDPGTRLFVLGLAPNASRLSIRFWHTDTLEAFATRIRQHYQDLRLEPLPWRTPPTIWRLALVTAPIRAGKAKAEDVPPQLAGELARAILTGARYPRSLLATLLMRMRADGDISGLRVALCKAILTRDQRLHVKGINQEIPMSLEPTNTEPCYVLGRLFAELENAQRTALGKQINATIRDRYYGAASATPAYVFPVLLRNAQHHLARLRKDKPGLAVNIEKEIKQIIDLLEPAFPKNMRLEQQGHFAIGYYHQTHAHFAKPDEKMEDEVVMQETGETA